MAVFVLHYFYGSSRITRESGFYLQEEILAVPVALGHPFNHFDPVVDPFELAGVHRPAHPAKDASPVA